ncbi:hypothetical protein I5Q34_33825 [Streptomyces sp. AV19]|uniref:DUF6760 family protein n=1 Tax=Streptomyces sp. AV19 TaxID=2793068 RepID=UPI0018FEBC6B|nr:DUF6760 family protein [Streptomyces sp. AV19]MBH1939181.1 hypothetical protein [Streptomyces sp. AV19]MDG4536911.1 hypothetical protein [Streptomyces sp. AV19]
MYAVDDLYREIAYIAHHFHWPPADILDMEHGDRHRYISEISAINKLMRRE